MSRRQNDKESQDLSMGYKVLGGLAAAAAIGGAAYAIIKACENDDEGRMSTNKNRMISGPTNSYTGPSSDVHSLYPGGGAYNTSTIMMPYRESRYNLVDSDDEIPENDFLLQRRLIDYYQRMVNIPYKEMRKAKEVLYHIKMTILDYLHEKYPNLVRDLVDCGSSQEDLKVIEPDEFDVMIPLYTNGLFNIKGVREVPGFVLVKREKNRTKCPLLDECLDDNYLSPEKLRKKFQSLVQKAVNNIVQYTVRSGLNGPSVTLNVEYDGGKWFSVDFVPTLKIKGATDIVAKPHVKYLKENNKNYGMLWRASYSCQEDRIFSCHGPESCEKICLKIVKAIRQNNSQLRMFHSYMFKTVMMEMIENDETDGWNKDHLHEHFCDFFKKFLGYLEEGLLPHHFNENVNLLQEFKEVREVINYLRRIDKKNKYGELLPSYI